jgi:hypothetical protein
VEKEEEKDSDRSMLHVVHPGMEIGAERQVVKGCLISDCSEARVSLPALLPIRVLKLS